MTEEPKPRTLGQMSGVLKDVYAKYLNDALARDLVFVDSNSEYHRKVDHTVKHPVTPEKWAEYEKVKEAFELVINSEFFTGYDYELLEPQPTIEFIYAETEEEWRERIAKLPQINYRFEVKKSRIDKDDKGS